MKKFILLSVAALALMFAGCDKENKDNSSISKEDFVGVWEWTDYVYTFNENGTFVCEEGGKPFDKGTWDYKDGKLLLTFEGSSTTENLNVVFLSNKNVLVAVDDYGQLVRYNINYKRGGTITSAKLTDGRWDAPHGGIKPKVLDDPHNDYNVSIVVKGNNVDVYILAWGFHLQGTFVQEDGYVKITPIKSWQGIWRDASSWGWSASGAPYEPCPTYVDDGIANMNPETFAIKAPWNNEEGDPNGYTEDLKELRLIVADDGKNAYGTFANVDFWMYKR